MKPAFRFHFQVLDPHEIAPEAVILGCRYASLDVTSRLEQVR